MKLHRLTDRLYLPLVLALAAAVRFINISKSSIWHDEGYTMMLAPQSPLQILARTARDVHPPLYYLTLHYWIRLFGTSELAARGLSAVFTLLIVWIGYLLVRELFNPKAARAAAWLLALAPFLVRYGQEARMYGMAAFLLLLATYLLVKALRHPRPSAWILYALVLAAALYTHYYAIFMIPVHWLYVLITGRIKTKGWWGANFLAALLFVPWLPSAYAQFSRVQAAFWIPKVTGLTLPNTLAQFLTFTDMGALPGWLRLGGTLTLALITLWAIGKYRSARPNLVLLAAYAFTAPLLVFGLSYKRPIYVDRYFVFAAVAFYCLLAVLVYLDWLKGWQQTVLMTGLSIMLVVGIRNVYAQSGHRMRTVAAAVSQRFCPGDALVSGELYTYFDFSYYNRTGTLLKLLAPNGVNGYGETSLLYDRAGQIVVRDLADLKPATGRIWLIGKTGPHDYFDNVPVNWTAEGDKISAGYVAAQRFRIAGSDGQQSDCQIQ